MLRNICVEEAGSYLLCSFDHFLSVLLIFGCCPLLYLMYRCLFMSLLYCGHQTEPTYHAVLKENSTYLSLGFIQITLTFDPFLVLFHALVFI